MSSRSYPSSQTLCCGYRPQKEGEILVRQLIADSLSAQNMLHNLDETGVKYRYVRFSDLYKISIESSERMFGVQSPYLQLLCNLISLLKGHETSKVVEGCNAFIRRL